MATAGTRAVLRSAQMPALCGSTHGLMTIPRGARGTQSRDDDGKNRRRCAASVALITPSGGQDTDAGQIRSGLG
ncbi:hypothetical protein ACRE_027690 [Hapsidospora chrysogenum ATCC 11550]|uniref:Uncharacterized protein n=1 Tax=Hapsidospora chrysogenum (strain ATCC 11550 / CBS 779.69 / DSM 880 / IAM 14645 / JCM 23072 / IMI 49137) TaxID=857340 RepID=A0A086TAG6_HAPC1|nr:hypothetical protein ACRE_027690 [Hapsidospora chrysogenum ATCC 11550]